MSELGTDTGIRIVDQVFDAIHTKILAGDYPGGARLRIRQLAAEMGTSVMPVREAIARLEEIGLVETSPHRGAVVKAFSAEELLEIYSVRRLLEIEATARGVRSLGPADRRLLDTEFQAMETALEAGDVQGYLDHDERLLSLVYAAAGNSVLVESIQTLWLRCRAYKLVGVRRSLSSGDLEPMVRFQRDLLRAIDSRDHFAASQATADSIDAAIERIRSALTK